MSVRRHHDLGSTGAFTVFSRDKHHDDTNLLSAAIGGRGFGQCAAILGSNLLSNGVTIRLGDLQRPGQRARLRRWRDREHKKRRTQSGAPNAN